MALTDTERSICNKLAYDSGGLLAPAQMVKGAVTNQLSATRSALSGYIQSPQPVIDAGKQTLRDNVTSSLPGDDASDVERMLDIINNCDYLNENENLKNPITLGNAVTESAFGKIYGYINDLQSIPEFLVSEALSALEEFYTNLFPRSKALSELLARADKLIDCLSNFCGGEYTSEVIALTNETQNLYNDFEMIGDPNDANYGKLNKDQLFADAGLTAGDIAKITDVNQEVDAVKADGKDAVDDFVKTAQNVKKLGSAIP